MSRTIIVDTRQKAGQHQLKDAYFEREGISTVRSKLLHGDYAFPPAVSVDTKADIYELAADVFQQHDRFRRELQGAQAAGTRLYILVENREGIRSLAELAKWTEPSAHFAKRKNAVQRISGLRLAKACVTMEQRYGATFKFCTPEKAGACIVFLLGGETRD